MDISNTAFLVIIWFVFSQCDFPCDLIFVLYLWMFSHVDLFWRCHYSPNWVVLSSFQCRENFCTTEGFTNSLQSTSFNLIILFGYAWIPTTWCIPHKSHLKWRLKFVWVFSRFCWRFSFMSEILKVLSWELRGIIDNKASKNLNDCTFVWSLSDARFF